jgi:ComF family protein
VNFGIARISGAVVPTWQAWLDAGLALLFPPVCPICERDIHDAGAQETPAKAGCLCVCTDCQRVLVAADVPRCTRCARALPGRAGGDSLCFDCREGTGYFDRAFVLGDHEGELRRCVLLLKHVRRPALSRGLIELLVTRYEVILAETYSDVVVPVPMHWRRRLRRGLNGPDALAGYLARRLQLPWESGLLYRSRPTLPQPGLTVRNRRRNVRNAFRVRKGFRIEGVSVLLVDDVITTGSTCGEAARVLKAAGARSVSVVALARARSG